MLNIQEILSLLESRGIDFSYSGDHVFEIVSFSSIKEPKPRTITWIKSEDYLIFLDKADCNLKEILLVAPDNLKDRLEKTNVIFCRQPKQVYFTVLNHFFAPKDEEEFRGKNSVIETDIIGKNVRIGHNCFVGRDVEIGDNAVIGNNVCIESRVKIGAYANIGSGTIIGERGFGFYEDSEGRHREVPHLGGVVIGEYTEIGANTCIDRGTVEDTVIESHVKIDNLCHISHNVHIEKNVVIVASTMISGSVYIEKDVYIGSSCVIRNQIRIGEKAFIGMGAVVGKDVPPNSFIVGISARNLGLRKEEREI